MKKTFDMQFIRYINLFGKITGVTPKYCFNYNNMIVFIVPGFAVERAIGRDNSNLKKLSSILEKRIRVLAQPGNLGDLQRFISVLVAPAQFEKVDVIEGATGEKEVVITSGGRENKAMLIGRGHLREQELKEILEENFGVKNLRIN